MLKIILMIFTISLSFSTAFAETKPECSLEEVTETAVTLGNALYKGARFDSIQVENVRQRSIGVHAVESYDVWLKAKGKLMVQLSLNFVIRNSGNAFYGKEGCGFIGTSIPFFQAP